MPPQPRRPRASPVASCCERARRRGPRPRWKGDLPWPLDLSDGPGFSLRTPSGGLQPNRHRPNWVGLLLRKKRGKPFCLFKISSTQRKEKQKEGKGEKYIKIYLYT